MVHQSSFGIANAREFFNEIVLPQHKEFVANNSSPRHALLAVIVAYHMYDWVHGENFSDNDFKLKYPSDKALANVFELARRITNGTKHFEPKKKKKVQKVQTRRQAGFSSGFNDGFDRSHFIATLPDDGTELSADDLLDQMVNFWAQQESARAF